MSKKANNQPMTAEVRQFLHFSREGDVIPHGWNKHIGKWHTARRTNQDGTLAVGRQVWRARPFAERLLARIVWFYTPSPIRNESGDVIGYRRKFKAQYWQMNQAEIAAALGCSRRTIGDELELLRSLGLVITQPSRARTAADGNKGVPLFVIPAYRAIAKLSVSDGKASEVSSQVPAKFLRSSLTPTLMPKESNAHVTVSYKEPACGEESSGYGDCGHSPAVADSSVQGSPPKTRRGKTTEPARKKAKAAPTEYTPAERKRDLLFDAVATVCNLEVDLMGSRIARTAHKLRKIGATPRQVYGFLVWWQSDKWRRENCKYPTDAKLLEKWKFANGLESDPIGAEAEMMTVTWMGGEA